MKNIMHVFVLRQMKNQKRRTIITILGVIVAVAMIAAVSSFAASFAELFYQVQADTNGEWHVSISPVLPGDRALIDGDPEVLETAVRAVGSKGVFPEPFSKYTKATVSSTDRGGFSVFRVGLSQGRFPENDRELLAETSFLESSGLKVGDPLEITDDNGETQKYTLCGAGTLNIFSMAESGHAYFLTLISDNMENKAQTVYIRLRRPTRALYDWAEEKCLQIPGEQIYDTHYSLLLYAGIGGNDEVTKSIVLISALLILIIMAAAVTLIFNSFAISVSERSAQFGMLSSVGATRRQRKDAVLFEGLVVALIAIPFGLLFGYAGIDITFRIVSNILTASFEMSSSHTLHLVISLPALLCSIALALVTVLLSAWVPARRAARVSPIDAIRRTQDIHLNQRAMKSPKLISRCFGFEGSLAQKNMKRHRGRVRVTVFSLAMSLILFISAYSFTNVLTASMVLTDMGDTGDLYATIWQEDRYYDGEQEMTAYELSPDTLDELTRELIEMPGLIQSAAYTRYASAEVIWPQGENVPFTEKARAMAAGDELYELVTAADDETLRALAEKAGADLNALYDTERPAALMVNRFSIRSGRSFADVTVLEAGKGDQLPQTPVTAEGKGESFSLTVAGVLEEAPLGMSRQAYSPGIILILSQPVYRSLMPASGGSAVTFAARSDTPDTAETGILEILERYYHDAGYISTAPEDADRLNDLKAGKVILYSCMNLTARARQAQQITLIFNIFVYGFITLLTLVGTANIIGTISTSFMLRKREFAMLKSVGMGGKAFDRMIMLESLFYGLKAILWGIPVSLALSYLMWQTMQSSFSSVFVWPFRQLTIGVIGIFLLVGLTMVYSAYKIRKDSIVEDLRLE